MSQSMSHTKRVLRPEGQQWHRKATLHVLSLAAVLVSGCSQMPAAPVRTLALPRFETCTQPSYPREAVRGELEGTVTMAFFVDTDGHVKDSVVKKSSGHQILDDAARLAVAKCTFTPATENGVAVAGWAPVAYVWSLK